MSPDVENFSWAMSTSTTVSCPKASWDTQARKCRTINSYKRPSLPWTQKTQYLFSIFGMWAMMDVYTFTRSLKDVETDILGSEALTLIRNIQATKIFTGKHLRLVWISVAKLTNKDEH